MTGPSLSSQDLQMIRRYYQSGATRPYAFRKQQLLLLKQAILKYESEINTALYADLKKSIEETYATETGLLLAEISVASKNTSQVDETKAYGD